MPGFGTWVPSDEYERPQRDALQQFMARLQPPGLAQAGSMLQEHMRSLGTVAPAARGAADLMDVFGRLGPIGAGDLTNPVQFGQRVGREAFGAAAEQGLAPEDVLNPVRGAQRLGTAIGASEAAEPLNEALNQYGQRNRATLAGTLQGLRLEGETPEQAAATGQKWLEAGEALAGSGPTVRTGIQRGARGRRVTPLTPEEQAARAADMQAEEGIFGAVQSLWRQGLSEEADDLRLLAMGKGRQGLAAVRDYFTERGLSLDPIRRFLVEEEGSVGLPKRLPTVGEVSETLTSIPLSAPSSLWSNVVSGGARTFQRWAQESSGAASQLSFRESLDDLMGMVQAVPGALRRVPQSVLQGPTEEVGANLAAGGLSRSTSLKARLATAGVRVNAATDELFRTLNESGAIARAQRRGLSPAEQAAKGVEAGDFATWAGNNTWVAEALTRARSWASDPAASASKKTAGLALSFIAPYVRMPERILRSTLQLGTDPINMAVQAGLGKGPLGRAARAGDKEAQRELAGRAIVGVLSWVGIVGSYASGQLHGAPPMDAKERRRLEAEGVEWNTWGGLKLRDLGNFGQAAGIIATALQRAERAAAKGQTPTGILEAAFNGAAGYIWDESYLQGFGDLAEALNDERFAEVAGRLGVRGVGRLAAPVTSTVGAFDPSEREVRGVGGEILNQLPGGRFALPEKIDPATGQAVQRAGNPLTRVFGRRGSVESPEARELARLGVPVQQFKATDKPFGVPQTPEARRVLQETYGRHARDYIRDTMARPDYKGASDEEKAATLQRQLNLAETLASIEVGDRVARDPQARFELEWLRTPQYRGVEGTPTQVARQNLEIREAKALLSEYQRRYGESAGRYRFYEEHPALIDSARRPEIPARALAEEREAVRRRTGAPDTRTAALPGAGNRVVPTPGRSPAFVAP